MHPGEAEGLARWAAALEHTRRDAEAQLTRPLSSPGLRCACALVQAVRLGRVVREGATLAACGWTQMRLTARAGNLSEALRLGHLVAASAGTLGGAGGSLLRAAGKASREGWAAWFALRRPRRVSPLQQIRRALLLGRAAWMALGGMDHDRR